MTEEQKARRVVRVTGDEQLDEHLSEILAGLDATDQRIAMESIATVIQLSTEGVSRLDRKIANTALKEMRHAFTVFAPYRDTRKVTIFGSARTQKNEPEYATARELGKRMAARGWMVVTGAGPGIMEAGHEGAAKEFSIGFNIVLPFEAKPNPIIADDPKLMNFKYFFTRKLMFIKESDGFVILPGGFGTLDECFELLTLVQTGKSDLHPIVLLDAPGGTYWRDFDRFIREVVLAKGLIDESDLALYRITDRVEDAMEELDRFYRVYHSERYVNGRWVLRLKSTPSDGLLRALSEDFADALLGPIERVEASPAEKRDDDVPDLARIAMDVNRARTGRLRLLIDRLNAEA